ncbi:tudor domain-containing protein 1-like isoform X2 [Euwallacea fornicatus]|uniref:tudor domain-containing protein 1-like isoform X2 n=1 Tax=Euwallacea fornicatus TaxID=995702 RepID=UPI00338F03CC
MERRNSICRVDGPLETLERDLLKAEFSKFGKINKIYINSHHVFAKVYLNNPKAAKEACARLYGCHSWKISLFSTEKTNKNAPENPNGNVSENGSSCPSHHSNSFTCENSFHSHDALSQSSGNNLDQIEDCYYVNGYVDIHGKPVDVLQGEDGKLFISLDDAANCGFNIYPKATYESVGIPKELEMQVLENYLVDQGIKYILNFKKTFNEDEMLGMIERVRKRLQNKQERSSGGSRVVQNAHNKNFSITVKTDVPRPNLENDQAESQLVRAQCSTESRYSEEPRPGPPTEHDTPGQGWTQNNQCGQLANTRMRKPRSFDNLVNNDLKSKPATKDEVVEKRKEMSSTTATAISSKPKECQDSSSKPEVEAIVEKSSKPEVRSRLHDGSNSGGFRMPPLYLERLTLNQGSSYKVKVSYVKQEKTGIFHGQLLEKDALIEEILLDLNQSHGTQPDLVMPYRNVLCMALYEGIWYRAVVLQTRPSGTILAELLDYGNKENILTPIKELPEKWKKVPAQAVRFALDQNYQNVQLKIDDEVGVLVMKHYEDNTHLVEISENAGGHISAETLKEEPQPKISNTPVAEPTKISSSESAPACEPEECFTELPPPFGVKLNPGESVMIVNITNGKLILRNKECGAVCKRIYGYISQLEKKPISSPKVGQLVLCCNDFISGLHRAVIKGIVDDVAEVEFLEYYYRDNLSIKSLRNVDSTLADIPRGTIEFDYPSLSEITKEGEDMLATLIQQKKKVLTIQVNDEIDVLIPVEKDQSVSLKEIILGRTKKKEVDLLLPAQESSVPVAKSAVQENNNVSAGIRIKFDDMSYVEIKEGTNTYCCYCCTGSGVTIMPVDDDALKHIETLGIIEPTDNTPYDVEEFHMCLATYEEVWYRAIVTEKKGNKREVMFVDYGNTEEVDVSHIRQLPERLKDVPIMGCNATFHGIPEDPKVHRRLQELVTDAGFYNINVISNCPEDMTCMIEIPDIYSTLRSEGLI